MRIHIYIYIHMRTYLIYQGGLSAFADVAKTPLAPPDAIELFSRGNEAASNLMGGFMGGLSSIGKIRSYMWHDSFRCLMCGIGGRLSIGTGW